MLSWSLIASSLAAGSLAASAAAQGHARPLPEPVPPHLVQQAELQLPAGTTLVPGSYALLELLVDAQGVVQEATVIEASDSALATAAADAAKRSQFEPARDYGGAIAARVRLRFEPPVPSEPAPVAIPTPAPAPAAEPAPVPTPAPQTPTPAPAASEPTAAAEAAAATATDEFGATARTDAPAREVTRRPIKAERVAQIAGANNDPLRAVETLPGVQRPPLGETLVLIRGSGENDSAIMVEGTPVLLLYHLDGLKSFLNPALLDRVDFYPGNFSVRYGRAIGGAIDARLRPPRRDAWHGIADISLLNASLLVEGPLSDRWSMAVAGRRSYIDALLALSSEDTSDTIVAAPLYWDYQGLLNYRASTADDLYLQTFGSSDSLAVLFPDDADPDLTELRGQLSAETQFHRALVGWKHRYGGGYAHDIRIGVGYLMINADVGDLVKQHARAPDFYGRSDWHLPLADWLTLDTGLDFVGYAGRLEYEGPQFRQQEVDPGNDLPPTVKIDSDVRILRPAAYAELTFMPIKRLSLIPGVRADYFGDIDAFALDPRFTARYGVTEATTLKAGVGRFSQPPQLGAAIAGLGNPELDPTFALHVSAGIEQQIGSALSIDVEGYYKRLYDMVVNAPGGEEPRLNNDGEGRIFGVELSIELETDDLFASLAYTLSRSERRENAASPRSAGAVPIADGEYLLFDYDQPHNLTVAAGYDLGKGWRLSSTFRLVSGNPETPNNGAVYAADDDRYLPLHGEPNSTRDALFHRLDMRVEKRFTLGLDDSITFYLDVQNALNVRRPEATAYSFDYRQRAVVRGLPVLPILGVRGEL